MLKAISTKVSGLLTVNKARASAFMQVAIGLKALGGMTCHRKGHCIREMGLILVEIGEKIGSLESEIFIIGMGIRSRVSGNS